MASLKGSKTEQNLLAAFAGESQARNRYTMAAKIAKKEGFEQISAIFMETDDDLKNVSEFLQNDDISFCPGLQRAPHDVAAQEGFKDASWAFQKIAEVEKWHERRYNKLIEAVQAGTVFKKPQTVLWKCRNCGRVIEAAEAPEICPSCDHPRAYFELLAENY